MADAVGQGGDPGGMAFQNEAEGQETARLLEKSRRKAAVEAVEQDVPLDDRPGGRAEDQIVEDGLQNHGEKDEGPGARQKGGPGPAPAAEKEHDAQGQEQGHKGNGDENDDGGQWHGFPSCSVNF